jgi:hypothetical protein
MVTLGCNGVIGDPGATGDGDTERPPPGESPVLDLACADDAPISVGHTPLRRLTADQYRHTVRGLLGVGRLDADTERSLGLIPDGRVDYFASSTQAPDPEGVRAYLTLSEGLASVARERGFDSLITCERGDAGCIRTFIEEFGRRAFRRPLASIDAALVDDYLALWREERDATDADTAFETLLTAFLLSPHFVYHAETADASAAEGELAPLDPYSIASRMSFLIWSAGPDDALLDAAATGELADAAGVEEHARAMLADDRARQGIRSFHEQWLRLSEVEGITRDDPQWREGMGGTLHEEVLRFVEHVVRDGEGTVRELLTASYSFPGEGVAELYGVEPASAPYERVVLTQPAVMAQFGTLFPEVHRGLFVREQLLCDPPAPPPPNVADLPIEDRTVTAPCNSCHMGMDPIGFGFAAYDSLGRFVPERARTGELVDTGRLGESDLPGTFENVPELAERLADSPEVEHCVTIQWVRYATGREVEAEDACGVNRLSTAFREAGGNIEELLVAIATSEGFRARHVSELE